MWDDVVIIIIKIFTGNYHLHPSPTYKHVYYPLKEKLLNRYYFYKTK